MRSPEELERIEREAADLSYRAVAAFALAFLGVTIPAERPSSADAPGTEPLAVQLEALNEQARAALGGET